MSKKCYRFFGGLLNAQAKWLNKMSEKGYRLVRTGRVLYEFEECSPDEVTYCVEFIGEKIKKRMQRTTLIFWRIWATRYFSRISI